MDTVLHDLRYAARLLRKTPIFTAVAVLLIAVGTASVTTIFSAVEAVLLGTGTGIGAPRAMVDVSSTDGRRGDVVPQSYPAYRDLRDRTRTLDGLAAYAVTRADVAVSSGGQREATLCLLVSGNYFQVLRVRPAVGRFIRPDEDAAAMKATVAVLGYDYWRTRFGGDRGVVGRAIDIDGAPFTVIGIAPPGFGGTVAFVRPGVFVPITTAPVTWRRDFDLIGDRHSYWLSLVGRLRPGVARAAAQSELTRIAGDIAVEHGGKRSDVGMHVAPLRAVPAEVVGPVSLFMSALMVVAALVLLIGSLNVAGMLLAQGVERRREFLIRLSVGAGRARLVRQLLTESLLLFAVGGAVGVLLTAGLVRLIERVHITVGFPVALHLAVDSRVLTFALALALVTGIVCGLAPALHGARGNLGTALRGEGAGAGTRRQRSRNAFVVTQLAMSVLLLVAAGLFLRALEHGRAIDPGFRLDSVATANIDLTNAGYDSTRIRSFFANLADRVRLEPGVAAVSYASVLPLSGSTRSTEITIPSVGGTAGSIPIPMPYATVGVDFFRVLGLPVIEGRAFLPTDVPISPPVAVVTEAFARKMWPSRSAIGLSFEIGKRLYTVVGVTRDAYLQSLQHGDQPFMFLSDAQEPEPSMTLVARVSGNPLQITAALRSVVASLDRRLAPPDVQSLEQVTAVSLLAQRIAAAVTGAFGIVGLLLAAVGLYGVIEYGVAQRTREFGIRIALGATPGMLSRLVIVDALRPMVLGLVIGLLLAMAAARVLAGLLFGVSATDPMTLVAVPGTLAVVALVASWMPARRAAHVDPMTAVRQE